MTTLTLGSNNQIFQRAQKIDLWTDGSAIQHPAISLGAGWVRVVDGKLVDPCRQKKITGVIPRTSNHALCAEIMAAAHGLNSLPKNNKVSPGRHVVVHTDHAQICDFINDPSILDRWKRRARHQQLVPHFNVLAKAIRAQGRVAAVLVPHRVKDLDIFSICAHNLAIQASGSRNYKWHPGLNALFGIEQGEPLPAV